MASTFKRRGRLVGRYTATLGGALLTLGSLSGLALAQTAPTPTPMATAVSATATAPTAVPSTATGTPAAATGAVTTPVPLPTAAPNAIVPLPPLTSEADLRVALDTLLMEHTYLAGQAIGPVLADQPAQAAAAASVLDANTQEMGNLLGAVYDQQTQQSFVRLWDRHLTDYVQYARAGMNGDAATQQQARADLLQFAQDMDSLLTGVNPDLPAGTVSAGLTMHVQGTLQVIDAMQAKDFPTAYQLGKSGADMTAMLGDPLALAIAQQYPDRFPAGTTTAQANQ
jgi:hypothetical protein